MISYVSGLQDYYIDVIIENLFGTEIICYV